jgi:hypothetical protein
MNEETESRLYLHGVVGFGFEVAGVWCDGNDGQGGAFGDGTYSVGGVDHDLWIGVLVWVLELWTCVLQKLGNEGCECL